MVYNIKAVCRDGGAVERARFEIVLCRNVYVGSNPTLCATKKDMPVCISFFVRYKELERVLRYLGWLSVFFLRYSMGETPYFFRNVLLK